MNGKPAPITITGVVQRIDTTGIGPNSGEVTLVIKPDDGPVVLVFAGILGSNPSPHGVEQGVYASYVNVALAAMSSGRGLSVTYMPLDKNRITGLSARNDQ